MQQKKLNIIVFSFFLFLPFLLRSNVAVSKKNSQEHTVAEGETLWEIAEKYLNDPFLWPKLWSMNPQLANPHKIDVGDRLRILIPTTVKAPQKDLSPPEAGSEIDNIPQEVVKKVGMERYAWIQNKKSRGVSANRFYFLDEKVFEGLIAGEGKGSRTAYEGGSFLKVRDLEDEKDLKLKNGEYLILKKIKEFEGKTLFYQVADMKAEKGAHKVSYAYREVKKGNWVLSKTKIKIPTIALTKNKIPSQAKVLWTEGLDKVLFGKGDFILLGIEEEKPIPKPGNIGYIFDDKDQKVAAVLLIALGPGEDRVGLGFVAKAKTEVRPENIIKFTVK